MPPDQEVFNDGSLRAEINALSQNVLRLTTSTDRLIDEFGRVGILETNHVNHAQAIDRAFAAIQRTEDNLKEHCTNDDAAHRGYDRWIWLVTGFCGAVMVFWTLIGYHVERTIDETVKSVVEMKIHVTEDKVKTKDDVRAIHKDER